MNFLFLTMDNGNQEEYKSQNPILWYIRIFLKMHYYYLEIIQEELQNEYLNIEMENSSINKLFI